MRTDDEIMTWLLSPSGPLPPGTEVTPQMVAKYRDNGAEQAMDRDRLVRNAEDAAYRSAMDANVGMMAEGPRSGGLSQVSDPHEAFMRFSQSGYSGKDALRDGWLAGTGNASWEQMPSYNAPVNAQGLTGPAQAMQAMYGTTSPQQQAKALPGVAQQQSYAAASPAPQGQMATAPGSSAQPGAKPATPATPPATPQPAMAAPSSMPAPPSPQPAQQQPSAPQPAAVGNMGQPPGQGQRRGFGSAPHWSGEMGGRGQFGQQQRAMRNMYGGG